MKMFIGQLTGGDKPKYFPLVFERFSSLFAGLGRYQLYPYYIIFLNLIRMCMYHDYTLRNFYRNAQRSEI